MRRKGWSHMKLFHLSDLHIGLKLVNRDLYEEQKYIFNQQKHPYANMTHIAIRDIISHKTPTP